MIKQLISLLVFVLLAANLAAQEPTGIVMLFRHGARGPSGETFDKTWGEMVGELTSVGMRQEFLRGAYLRKLYPNLLAKYDPNTISIRSTDYNRTIMSVYSMLDGMFGGTGPSFDPTYPLERATPLYTNFTNSSSLDVFPNKYQPVPIHTVELAKDELLFGFTSLACPYAAVAAQNRYREPQLDEVWSKFVDTQDQIKKAVNASKTLTKAQIFALYDTMMSNYFEGKALPGGIDPKSELGKNLTFLFSFTDYFVDAGSAYQRQLYSMNPLTQFKNDLGSILNGSNTVIRLYSAHDSTIVPILAMMGIANHECLYKNYFGGTTDVSCTFPPYASALRFEVFKNQTDFNASMVKVLFNEIEQNICNSSDGHCTWSTFQDVIQNYTEGKTIDYYRSQCTQSITPPPKPDNGSGNGTSNGTDPTPAGQSNSGLFVTLYSLAGVAGVLLISIVVVYRKNKEYDSLSSAQML